ncbi:hypothetical protein [Liquorilactobacillus mali]|uniref:Uncharacterized protein n=1 Tax=Liquorilactobacillus mali TaxID=1618 RepID=A0A0R2FW13_9LACO|nr:hypothetical protein [Liquorilactobacillus mali]KRN31622.1 hypothetical protein IV36_GL001745 [Liquorilactobacillus mali]
MNDIFDKGLKTSKLRGSHIRENIDEVSLNEKIRGYIGNDTRFSDTGLSQHLENLADYFLESEDVKSNRRIEKSFFKNEREYGKYNQSKATLISEENTLDWLCDGVERGTLTDEYIEKLVANMGGKDVMRWVISMHEHLKEIPLQMKPVLKNILDSCFEFGTYKEQEVFTKAMVGLKLDEIAEIRETGVRNVQKQFKNICNKIAERVRNSNIELSY